MEPGSTLNTGIGHLSGIQLQNTNLELGRGNGRLVGWKTRKTRHGSYVGRCFHEALVFHKQLFLQVKDLIFDII